MPLVAYHQRLGCGGGGLHQSKTFFPAATSRHHAVTHSRFFEKPKRRRRHVQPHNEPLLQPLLTLLAYPMRNNDIFGQSTDDTTPSSLLWSSSSSSFDDSRKDSSTSLEEEEDNNNDDELTITKRTVLAMLRRNEMKQALDVIRAMVDSMGQNKSSSNSGIVVNVGDVNDEKYRLRQSQCVDEMIQALTRQAFFVQPGHSNQRQVARHVQIGVDALHLQLQSSTRLVDPYHLVPKMTLVNALKALTRLNEINPQLHVLSPSLTKKNQRKQHEQQKPDYLLHDATGSRDSLSSSSSSSSSSSTWTAFRILQRLITGVGVRKTTTTTAMSVPLQQQQQKSSKRYYVYERDINMVLNAFSDAGQMNMAHRIVALQERTQHAPPLSPVAYSILLKGYGRLSDLKHVQLVVQHAEKNNIQPDVILLNSLIDAYINCHALDKAKTVFDQMRQRTTTSTTAETRADGATGGSLINDKNRGVVLLFANHPCPPPNKRTYNTILKGLANAGCLQEAMTLADEMQACRIWDDVSTNTLVHAAVLAGDLALAEQFLKQHAATPAVAVTAGQTNNYNEHNNKKQNQHPNVEAYTELLDGYAKAGQMANALSVLQRMRQQHIEPNQITYTCLVAGFGRSGRVKEAMKMVEFMSNSSSINSSNSNGSRGNIRPTIVTFNALISGLVAGPQCAAYSSSTTSFLPHTTTSQECTTLEAETLDFRVDEALEIVRCMMKMGVRPNTVTVSTIVHALGRCSTPRVKEAVMLVEKLERQKVIPYANPQVATNLIRTCGIGNDLKGAVTAFRKLKSPDVVAINAFMDACCRCERVDLAVETFGFYFQNKNEGDEQKREADVISYSVLISAFIKSGSLENLEAARKYYGEMKTESLIRPDKTLIDIILKGMIRVGRSKSLSKRDVYFVASVLRDAKKLKWAEGQLERRQRAARAVLTQQFRNDEVALYSILQVEDDDEDDDDDDDELFQRKGWNKVDSGFRLWGGGYSEVSEPKKRKSPKKVDKFLQKKGWNTLDSGFRIL